MKKPDWFENKITLGNLLTMIPLGIAAVVAYADLRNDTVLLRASLLDQRTRIEKLEARDDLLATQFAAQNAATLQALARIETQVGILMQERRLPSPLGGAR